MSGIVLYEPDAASPNISPSTENNLQPVKITTRISHIIQQIQQYMNRPHEPDNITNNTNNQPAILHLNLNYIAKFVQQQMRITINPYEYRLWNSLLKTLELVTTRDRSGSGSSRISSIPLSFYYRPIRFALPIIYLNAERFHVPIRLSDTFFHQLDTSFDEYITNRASANLNTVTPIITANNITQWRPSIRPTRHYTFYSYETGSHRTQSEPKKRIPEFKFDSDIEYKFDFGAENFTTVCMLIKENKGISYTFSSIKNKTYAYGSGANKHVYNQLWKEIVGTIMKPVDSYFMDVNTDHLFWDSEENIECFVVFVAMTIQSGCTLPFHFVPLLLESISHKLLTLPDLELFMEIINPDVLRSAKTLSVTEFQYLDCGFDTHAEYYRNILESTSPVSDNKQIIYQLIAQNFGLFESFYDFDTDIIDHTFSGKYKLTAEMVIPMFIIDKEIYEPKWNQFIESLTETELRHLLMVIGNSTSVKNSYRIYVNKFISEDVQITTCSNAISIREDIFTDPELFDNLKHYFNDDTMCVDEYIGENNHNNSDNEYSDSTDDDE